MERNEQADAQDVRFSTTDTLDEPVINTIVRLVCPGGLLILNYHSKGPRFVLHIFQAYSSSVPSTDKRP